MRSYIYYSMLSQAGNLSFLTSEIRGDSYLLRDYSSETNMIGVSREGSKRISFVKYLLQLLKLQ